MGPPSKAQAAKSLKVLGSYEALKPFIDVAKRDGPALLADAIATARSHEENSGERLKGMVPVLQTLVRMLIDLPAPSAALQSNEDLEPFKATPPSPADSVMARYAPRVPPDDGNTSEH